MWPARATGGGAGLLSDKGAGIKHGVGVKHGTGSNHCMGINRCTGSNDGIGIKQGIGTNDYIGTTEAMLATAMSILMTRINGARRRVRVPGLVGLALAAGLLAAGCSQGAYPLDIFYEMHYQPSYKAQEPPRLSPPASAVPWYGATAPEATSFGGSGKHIFETNCAMCHGVEGRGDGPVLGRMIVDYGYQATDAALLNPDLTSEAARSLDREGLRGVVIGGVNVMPSFAKLLTEEQIELALDYVQGCIQDGDAGACE